MKKDAKVCKSCIHSRMFDWEHEGIPGKKYARMCLLKVKEIIRDEGQNSVNFIKAKVDHLDTCEEFK